MGVALPRHRLTRPYPPQGFVLPRNERTRRRNEVAELTAKVRACFNWPVYLIISLLVFCSQASFHLHLRSTASFSPLQERAALSGDPVSDLNHLVIELADLSDGEEAVIKAVVLCNVAVELLGPFFGIPEPVAPDLIAQLAKMVLHPQRDVRIAVLRTLRYATSSEIGCVLLAAHRLEVAIARSLECEAPKDGERREAMQITRSWLHYGKVTFPGTLVATLVSVSSSSDALREVAIETLCEVAVAVPALAARHGAFGVILRASLESETTVVIEAHTALLAAFADTPELRKTFDPGAQFPRLLAPFTEFDYQHARHPAEGYDTAQEYMMRLTASSIATASLLRTWPGVFYLSGSQLGISTLVKVFRLQRAESQNTLLALFYSIFLIDLPPWVDTLSAAITNTHPSTSPAQPGCRGKLILRSRLDLLDNYIAMLIVAFENAGLIEALVSVIVTTSDRFVGVRTTVLLAELMALSFRILPSSHALKVQALPSLVEMIGDNDISLLQQARAREAVSNLEMLEYIKKTEDSVVK